MVSFGGLFVRFVLFGRLDGGFMVYCGVNALVVCCW